MCCSDAPEPPDMSAMSDAQLELGSEANALARETFQFAQEKWVSQQEMLDKVLAVQMPMMKDQYENAKNDRARYEQTYQPLQDKAIADAESYNTMERQNEEAGNAIADVGTAFDAQRTNAQQNLESYGIDPSQTRSNAIDADVRMAEATAKAGAGNMARRRVEQTGRVLRGDAINMGNGMASQAAQGYGGALNAGNAGMSNTNQTVGAGVQNMGAGNQYMNTALSGYGGAANTTNMGYQNTLSQYNSGFGASDLLGLGVGAVSSYYGASRGAEGAEGGAVTTEGIGIPAYAEGGMAEGGGIPPVEGQPSGGPKADDVPARLSAGEFVVPAETMAWKGQEFFEKTIAKSAEDRAQADAVRQEKQGIPMQGPQPVAPQMGAV